jgi:hypothetical protein
VLDSVSIGVKSMDNELSKKYEQNMVTTPIIDLLPRYLETHDNESNYRIERLMNIDGHEVAWMSFDFVDDESEADETINKTNIVECACAFAENVGWELNDKYGYIKKMAGTECAIKKQAIDIRHQEIRQEYITNGTLDAFEIDKKETIKAVILDLIERSKAGEVLEANNGARFWGGYFYLQSVNKILNAGWNDIWLAVDEMCEEKIIHINGMVVEDYNEPKPKQRFEDEDKLPEAYIYKEKDGKIWALIHRPEFPEFDYGSALDAKNTYTALEASIAGLAHNEKLAKERAKEAALHPRESYDRLYFQSFTEANYHKGPLTVVVYEPSNDYQKKEFIVEAFLGDAVVPEIKKIKKYYNFELGNAEVDQENLNKLVDAWFPANDI